MELGVICYIVWVLQLCVCIIVTICTDSTPTGYTTKVTSDAGSDHPNYSAIIIITVITVLKLAF